MKILLSFALMFCSVLVFNTGALNAQTKILDKAHLKVIYEFKQEVDSRYEPTVLSDTMALVVGQHHSVYFDWNKERNDSIYKARIETLTEKIQAVNVIKDESMLQSRLESYQEPTFVTDESRGESAKVFKNRVMNEVTTIDMGPRGGVSGSLPTYLEVVEAIAPQEWDITADTLTVLDYVCLRATTTFRGRDYSAWFTLDIPIGDGPWKLYGLPGMILKAEDSEGIFHFEAIGIMQSANENIELPADGEITKSTLKQLRDYRKNRFKEITYGYFEGGTLSMYRARNLVEYNDLENNIDK